MGYDFRLDSDFFDHPKTEALVDRCGPASPICLLRLWGYATKYHPDGKLSEISDARIEEKCKWAGEPGVFVAALVSLKFLDGSPNKRKIHDWKIHQNWVAGRPERSRVAKANAQKRWENRDADGIDSALPVASTKVDAPQKASESPITSEILDLNTICTEPSQTQAPVQLVLEPETPPSPVVAELPTNKAGKEFPVTQAQVDEWRELYPAVDVDQELRNMRGWLNANTHRRKTFKGMPSFANSWLSRQQNKGGTGTSQGLQRYGPQRETAEQAGRRMYHELMQEEGRKLGLQ